MGGPQLSPESLRCKVNVCAGVLLFPERVPPISFLKGFVLPTGMVPLLYSRIPIPDGSTSVSWPDAVLGWFLSLASVFPSVKWGQSQPWSPKVQDSREKVWEALVWLLVGRSSQRHSHWWWW